MKRTTTAVAVLLVAITARADDRPALQRMRFIERGRDLTVTTTVGQLFDANAYEALRSGFTSTVHITTAVYARDTNEAIAVRWEQRTVVYDLWDEQYIIHFEGPAAGKQGRTRRVKQQAEALKVLTAVDDFPVASLVNIQYQQVFYLLMTVQLNPVDEKTLAEVRRWLSQGTGGGLDRGGVFFGSFVSVFVNPKMAKADRVLRLRSQPFYRPRP